MKKAITILLLLMATAGVAQTKVTVDNNGNYRPIRARHTHTAAQVTGKYFIDNKGAKYPVYQSVKGSLYIIRTSKKGNQYKQYLKA